MDKTRSIQRIVLLLGMSCCLTMGVLTSPALAKIIVVTTLNDVADPPFNADGLCGTGTLANLPGADGLVSLREAIIAANNTPGSNVITFASSLSGGTIVVNFDDLDADSIPDPLPALCSGQTRIDGDLNDDDTPDITLEGGIFPAPSLAAGLLVPSSHNSITGLHIQHFPFGIVVIAGLTAPGTVAHNTIKNNTVTASTLDGIVALTGDAPGSILADTTITQNLVRQNAFFGILVLANQSAIGSDTQVAHTTITDNAVRENGSVGIAAYPQGAHNHLTDLTIARNIASANAAHGILVYGGVGDPGENSVEVNIHDNTVTNNGGTGIRLLGGGDNSSHNQVSAHIKANSLKHNHPAAIVIRGGFGEETFPSAGTSVHNVVDVRIEQNTLQDHDNGINIFGGAISTANNNQVSATLQDNIIRNSTVTGIGLGAGGSGIASNNTLAVRVIHNTVCGTGTDIIGEGGFSGSVTLPDPNLGTGNILTGAIAKNTATTVTVANGVPGNTATATQVKNFPCP